MPSQLILICGPTATGKTRLGVALAKALGGRGGLRRLHAGLPGYGHRHGQAYPGGTPGGCPTTCWTWLTPGKIYSVARYVQDAVPIVDAILARGRLPIVAGGTGLYLDALVAGREFAPFTPAAGLREELQARAQSQGLPVLRAELERIDASGLDLGGAELICMCDIDNPMCGPHGAAAVFGPQKGADEAMVERLDQGLRHLAEIVKRDLGRDILDLPGAGAAGGMGGGCQGLLGGRLQMGIETVLDLVDFDKALQGADLVLTGEGKLDRQSLRGKVVIGIAHRARQARVPVVAVVGDVAPGAEDAYQEGVTAIVSTNRRAVPWEVARQSARADLCAALEDLFRLYNAFRTAR